MVCRFESGPKGTRDFKRSKHSRKFALLGTRREEKKKESESENNATLPVSSSSSMNHRDMKSASTVCDVNTFQFVPHRGGVRV